MANDSQDNRLAADNTKRMSRPLEQVDPEIAQAMRDELRRQSTGLALIPSENFVSEAVSTICRITPTPPGNLDRRPCEGLV